MKSIIFYKKVTSSFHSNRWTKVRGSGIISTSRTQQKFLGVSTCVILINYLIVIKSNLLSKLRFVDVTLCLLLVSMIRCVSIQCIYPWITREFGYMQRRLIEDTGTELFLDLGGQRPPAPPRFSKKNFSIYIVYYF